MLQWMGGSRRKVNTSRKSTHNRQKQYFEQRKRQQQTPGENWIDARKKCASYHEEPRSLDILSLTNLATVAQQEYPTHVNEVGISQETSHVSKLSPAAALKKIISKFANDLEEARSEPVTISPKKSSEVTCPQVVSSAYKRNGKLDRSKISASPSDFANTGPSENQQTEEAQNFLDLLSDEGPRSVSEKGLAPEAHVAFSIEGLGNIGVETPAQSPNLNYRLSCNGSPSLLKASQQTSSVKLKPILHDLSLELNALMNDVKMSDVDSPLEILTNSVSILDDVGIKKSTKFVESSSMHPFDSDDQIFSLGGEEEDIYTHVENRKGQSLSDKFGILDDNFLDKRKYEPDLADKSFYTERYPSIRSRSKNSEYDLSFEDPDLLNSRISGNLNKRFDISASFSPSFRNLTSDKDYSFVPCDYERYPGPDNSFSFEARFDPHAWSFLADEDVEDSMSLLSEESCSSTAVRKEKRYDLGSHSVKLMRKKINLTDDHEPNITSKWKYAIGKFAADETFYTGVNKAIQAENMMGTGNCKSGHKRSFEAGGFSAEYSSYQGMLEPQCISLFDEGYTSLKAAAGASSHRRTSKPPDNRFFHCKLLPEDFDHYPDLKLSPDIDLSHKSPFNVPANHEPSDNFICEGEISRQASSYAARLQKPAKYPVESEEHFPNSSAWDVLKHTKFPDMATVQKVSIYKEHASRKILEKPHFDAPTEKKSLSSVNSGPEDNIADCRESSREQEVSNVKTQESFDRTKTKSSPEEPEETPRKLEVSTQIQNSVDDKIDQPIGGSSVPSQVGKKDSRKEKFEADLHNDRSKGGNSSDTSYQVMLERYVLQLLCVQKVLMEASEKDIGKKIITWKEDHSFDLVSFGTPHH